MVLEVLGLVFLGLSIVVAVAISGAAYFDWYEYNNINAPAAFWFCLLVGIVLLIIFSVLSGGASIYALYTPPLAGI